MLRLQRDLHPDRFAQSGEKAVELARELSGRVNEAYAVLSDPLKRADYLVRWTFPYYLISHHRFYKAA